MECVGRLADEMRKELTDNILPFWMKLADPDRGGFYGQITGRGELHPDAPRASVLNMRLLWTFAAAFRVTGDLRYREMAERAKIYVERCFVDPEYGGVYWSVDAQGQPLDAKKQIYSQGFAIYGMSEYYRATGDESALACAKALFEATEAHAHDARYGGYWGALGRGRSGITGMRVGAQGLKERKARDTHPHVVGAQTKPSSGWECLF